MSREAEYNARKEQEIAEHETGYSVGGPVDTTKSQAYQFGQSARLEDDDPFYCGICKGLVPISQFEAHYH